MEKLKILWFGLVPLGWFISFELVKWAIFYPVDYIQYPGIGAFMILTCLIGIPVMYIGSVLLSVYLVSE